MRKNGSGNAGVTRFAVVTNLVIVVFLLVGYASGLLRWNSPEKGSETMALAGNEKSPKSTIGSILEGTVGGIPYLHCSPSSPSTSTDLVLLHGAAFTKEIWRTNELLQNLCKFYSVTALDLNTRSGRKELKEVLDAMKDSALCNLPVNIITPSASGNTIVDWLDDTSELKRYIHKWIPVASPAIARADEDKLRDIGDWLPILAIYGDQDKGGEHVSNILGEFSRAKVDEIPGKHPCYLQSPDLFVTEVRAFLEERL